MSINDSGQVVISQEARLSVIRGILHSGGWRFRWQSPSQAIDSYNYGDAALRFRPDILIPPGGTISSAVLTWTFSDMPARTDPAGQRGEIAGARSLLSAYTLWLRDSPDVYPQISSLRADMHERFDRMDGQLKIVLNTIQMCLCLTDWKPAAELAKGDFNGDGKTDIAVYSPSRPTSVAEPDPGRFTARVVKDGGASLTITTTVEMLPVPSPPTRRSEVALAKPLAVRVLDRGGTTLNMSTTVTPVDH